MISVFAAGIIQGLILCMILFSTGRKNKSNLVLGLLSLIASLHLFLVMVDNRELFPIHPHLSRITWLIPSLYGPLIFLYTNMVTRRRKWFVKTDLWIFIPFLIFLGILLPYYIQPAYANISNMQNPGGLYNDDFDLINQAMNFVHLFFITGSLIIYYRNLHLWKTQYSDPEIIRTRWLAGYLLLILGIVIVSVVVFYANKFNFSPLNRIYQYLFLGTMFLLYLIGYKALLNPVILLGGEEEKLKPIAITEDYRNQNDTFQLDPDRGQYIAGKIHKAMEADLIYRNPELSLNQLSRHIQESRHHVSEVIDTCFNASFYNLVNEHRVRDFIKRVNEATGRRLTLIAQVRNSGFRSMTTFNMIFKKKTGLTPTEYFKNEKINF